MLMNGLGDAIIAIGLTIPRVAAAFLVLPLLSQDTVPALVRNSLFVALAIVIFPMTGAAAESLHSDPVQWPFLLLKEMLIGVSLGLLFGSIFWAIGMAGAIADTQVGGNMANAMDPIQGHQTSFSGQWLSQLATWLFLASGGFMLFLDLLLGSYQLWPVHQLLPSLSLLGSLAFINEFRFMVTTALLFAAPAMLLMLLIDLTLGVLNRFAQQMNLLAISMPIKSMVTTGTWIVVLGAVVEVTLTKLGTNQGLLSLLDRVWRE